MWRLAWRVGRRLRREIASRRAVRAALRQARAASRRRPVGHLRFCWDLDNTLVNSGVLIRMGQPLQEAVIQAEPVPNMVDFYRVVVARFPEASHFILSARTAAMRSDTLAWLERYRIATEDTVCFVPTAEAKTRVWQQLAQNADLVIIDDLSFNHERDEPTRNDDLIEMAQRVAVVYIGADEIATIAADSQAIEETVSRIIATSTTTVPVTETRAEGRVADRGGRS
jgi:hypothetical protein